MTDNFEQTTQRILKEARANGGVTADHLLDALVATNEDIDAQHEETRVWHEQVTGMVSEHIDEAKERDRRLDGLEGWRLAVEENCEARTKRICAEEHTRAHADYVATLADSGKSFSLVERRVWAIWGVLIFIAITVANAVLMYGLDKILHP